MNCPICNKEMQYQYWGSEWGTEESLAKCPNKCYYEQFAYGGTEIQIGGIIFHKYYTDSVEYKKKLNEQIKAVIEIEKEYINYNYIIKDW